MLPDGSGGLEDVEVLEDVWDGHEPHGTQESEADPSSVEVDRDKGGRDGEVVDEGVELQHEEDLVGSCNELRKGRVSCLKTVSSTHSNEEVDHEKDVEGKINLLRSIFHPRNTLLDTLGGGVDEVDDEGGDGEDEDHRDEDLPHPGLCRDQLARPVLCLRHEVALVGFFWVLPVKPHLLRLLLGLLLVLLAVIVLGLGAEEPLDNSDDKNGNEPEEEGEDGGEEEAPPFSLLQALLVVHERDALRSKRLLADPHHEGRAQDPFLTLFLGLFDLLLFWPAHAEEPLLPGRSGKAAQY